MVLWAPQKSIVLPVPLLDFDSTTSLLFSFFGISATTLGRVCGLSMGSLDEENFNVELESGAKFDYTKLGLEEQPETLAIQNAVTVLLKGLGEDINREGLKKTPFRVAKALLYGTKGPCSLNSSSLFL